MKSTDHDNIIIMTCSYINIIIVCKIEASIIFQGSLLVLIIGVLVSILTGVSILTAVAVVYLNIAHSPHFCFDQYLSCM